MTDKLEELEKRLYQPGEGFAERRENFAEVLGREAEPVKPPPTPPPLAQPGAAGGTSSSPPPPRRILTMRSIIVLIAAFLGLASVVIGAWAVFFRGPTFFRRDVVITATLPSEIRGGEEVTLEVLVDNRTPFTLHDAELTLVFPEGSVISSERRLRDVRPVGTISSQSVWRLAVPTRMLGPKDTVKTVSARLTYRPGNISSRFENTTETTTTIRSVPFRFAIEHAKEAFPASTVRYVLTYENTAGIAFDDAALEVKYPDKFKLVEAAPLPEVLTRWELGRLSEGTRGTITLTGTFDADARLDQEFRAELGVTVKGEFVPYAEVASVTRIVKPFLEIEPTVQGRPDYAASPGERLSFAVRWANTGTVTLEEVRLSAKPKGELFELGALNPRGGVFDSRTDTLTWTSREVPGLALVAPNASGTASFDIDIKRNIPLKTAEDRHFAVEVEWTIETARVPAGLNLTKISRAMTIRVPLTSRVELTAVGFYSEPSRVLTNTGPHPPRANETTTYTIHWLIKSYANPVERIAASAFLASGVEFLDKAVSISGNAPLPQFNDRSGEITWAVERVEPGVGTFEPPLEVAFQIGLTPSILQKGTTPVLVTESRLTAVDGFTQVRLEAQTPRLTTADIAGGGAVQ